MNSFLKFRLLVWKNYLVQKRKPIATSFSIGLPTLFSFILMMLRLRVESTPYNNPTLWDPCPYEKLPSQYKDMTLAYSPENHATRSLMKRVEGSLGLGIKTEGFPNEDVMVKYITLVNGSSHSHHYVNNSQKYLGGIPFDKTIFNLENNVSVFDTNVEYKIRLSYAPRYQQPISAPKVKHVTSWLTDFMFPPFRVIGPRNNASRCNGGPGYASEGFLAIQAAINDGLMRELLSEDQLKGYNATNILLRRHPYPPFKDDKYVLVLQQQFPFIIMLSIIITILGMVKDIVLEKERKLKESMKMMGINNWLHWVAWFTKHLLFLLISVVVMTAFYCIPLDSEKGGVIAKSNPFIVFLYLICYSIACITYSFAISTFFSKANTGAAIGGIVFFCLYIPYMFLQPKYATMSVGAKMISCLDFQLAMSFGGTLLGQFEGVGLGVQFNNMAKGVSVDDDFSMLIVLVMLLFDSCIHCLIAWYVEAVFPGDYGVPQPWYFPFLPSYWGCSKRRVDPIDLDSSLNIGQDPDMFEKELSSPIGVQIRNLRKVYSGSGKKKVAVAGMTMNMYKGQITALLGHNGAGKTTTMSMLSGFYPPTSGTAIIDGCDIREEMSEIRSSLGLCPQHDILFDNLTVEEHMIFFSLLKGVQKDQVIPECKDMLTDMELYPKLKAKSKTLSGGMKRKLSVCIALIGNSKVVFLDEPSSGLDPNARRNIWTVLQKNRAGRTMILSTHFMDEADLLGDRIAIMAGGIVKCCGSSLFLKKKFGAGYHMVVVKKPHCDVNLVIALVKSHIPTAEVESNVGAELSFILPQECVGNFEALFTELEQRQEMLGISSFGASVTTMEEVFLKVGESDDVEMENLKRYKDTKGDNASAPELKNGAAPFNANTPASSLEHSTNSNNKLEDSNYDSSYGHDDPAASSDTNPIVLYLDGETQNSSEYVTEYKVIKNVGTTLYLQQFYAMFMKRILHTLRNKLVTITQIIVPLFFTILGIVSTEINPSFVAMPALKLVPDSYHTNYIPYHHDPQLDKMADVYVNQFQDSSYVRTTDVNNVYSFDLANYLVKEGKDDMAIYNLEYMVAADFTYNQSLKKSELMAYFNNEGYHSIAISLAAIYNGLIKFYSQQPIFGITTYNHPLPRLAANKANDILGFKDPKGFVISFSLSFGMAFLASSFVVFLVKERSTKAKHIQFVSGVHPFNFWLSTLFWDMINFLLPCVLMLIVFVAFSISNYTEDLHWLEVLVLFLMYGWGMLPFMYFFSFAFDVPATAYVWITMFNMLTGIATQLVVIILEIPQIGLADVSKVLEWVFMVLFPNFNLSQGLFEFYQNDDNIKVCKPLRAFIDCKTVPLELAFCCPDRCVDTCLYFNLQYLGWEKNGIGRMLFFLAVQGVLCWALIFMYEYGLIQKLRYSLRSGHRKPIPPPQLRPRNYMSQLSKESVVGEDEDVLAERHRIDSTPPGQLFTSDKLILNSLTKYYGNFCAVDHLSVGIPSGECFGLLGINGAGKTSTFMMLTGDSVISSGNAYLDSFSLKTEKEMARNRLGYCPQFDALIGQLTGRETLYLYARLRGVQESQISFCVNNIMEGLTLTPYADRQCRTYSGGNMRKLSTAIALIGDPEVVFLDEPTTGMDPVARRMLWLVLARVRDSGRTLVLTSHSMEECEALCTRLAIMVNGQFKCLGSIQHLKTKFGEGYTFNAKVRYPEDGSPPNLVPLQEFLESTFQHCKLMDVHENMVNYHIIDDQLTWAQVFGHMERVKERLDIEDYLVSQTSLEQVFINFARMQDSDDNPGGASSNSRRSRVRPSSPSAPVPEHQTSNNSINI